jgi:hypothetical protein
VSSFPVDDQTLDLLDAALTGTSGPDGRSSVGDLCQLYSEMAGSDPSAVESTEDDSDVQIMRDPVYHPNEIIAALVAEVRRLRAHRAPVLDEPPPAPNGDR